MEEEIKQLKKKVVGLTVAVTILGCLAVFAIAYGASEWLIANSMQKHRVVRCETTDDGGIFLSAQMDGPFVVTHVVVYPSRSVVTLPQPLGFVESGSHAEFSREQLKKLTWISGSGSSEVLTAPEKIETCRALYLRPEYSPE